MTQPRTRSTASRTVAWATALAIAIQPLAASAQEEVRLPDLGGNSEVLPPDEARTFPSDFRNYMRSQGILVEDPIIDSYFTEMGYRLVMHSSGRTQDFHFHILKVPGINAFAAPAGVVALNAGLVLAARSADEVAGVLAHEVSHVTQNHLSRGMEEARNISIPVMLATLGLVVVGGMAGGLDGDAAQGILATGAGLSQQAQINYTRQNEAEADRIGIQLLVRAGFDPAGMVSFFDTLNRWVRTQGAGPPEYLRTHPMTVTRVAEARQRTEQFAASAATGASDPRFAFVQARLRVLMARNPADAAEYFQTRLARESGPDLALRYGLAMALIEARRTGEAREQVDRLLGQRPDDQLFRMLLGDLLVAEGRTGEALEAFSALYRDYGHSTAVSLAYADVLLRSDDPEHAKRASDLLQTQLRRNPDDAQVSEMLAHAADRAGDPVRAAEAVATHYYQLGGLPQAIEQLRRVLERDDLDYYDRARISARLDQLQLERLRSGRDENPGPEAGRVSRDRKTSVMIRS